MSSPSDQNPSSASDGGFDQYKSLFGITTTTKAPAVTFLILFAILTLVTLWNAFRIRRKFLYISLLVYLALRIASFITRLLLADDPTNVTLSIISAIFLAAGYIILARILLRLLDDYLIALFPKKMTRKPFNRYTTLIVLALIVFLILSIVYTNYQIQDLVNGDFDKALGIDKTMRVVGAAGSLAIVVINLLGVSIFTLYVATTTRSSPPVPGSAHQDKDLETVGHPSSPHTYPSGPEYSPSMNITYPGYVLVVGSLLAVWRSIFGLTQLIHAATSEGIFLSMDMVPELLIMILINIPPVIDMWKEEAMKAIATYRLSRGYS
ncbi:MAG: hypothetical protein DHS80DRAFT_23223 [Piptocephalis tieghemiana]|nr:MAG: hypothetical protein DHS80DRAFT_23223 [Piptocephalis tieghemiana]